MKTNSNSKTKYADFQNKIEGIIDDSDKFYSDNIFRLEQRLRAFDDEIRALLPYYKFPVGNSDLLGRIPEQMFLEYLKLQEIVFLKKILVLNFKLNGRKNK